MSAIWDAKTLPEPQWYAMIANLARTHGGQDLIHELSKAYPGYSEDETNEKIQHALEDGAPHSCQYIQNELQFEGCPEGGCGVNAPVSFAVNKVTRAKITVTNLQDRIVQSTKGMKKYACWRWHCTLRA